MKGDRKIPYFFYLAKKLTKFRRCFSVVESKNGGDVLRKNKKTRWNTWDICLKCRQKKWIKKPYCVPTRFFELFEDPFKAPEEYKCKGILWAEKEKAETDAQKLSNKCIGCGLECKNPRYINMIGGENCERDRINKKNWKVRTTKDTKLFIYEG